jgi:hypothetical protein
MYSVDLSADRYFSSRGLPYRLLTYAGHRRVGGLRYERLDGPEAYADYREVVFWGDFQQNPIWGLQNHAPRVARDRRVSVAEGIEEWKRRFLLRGVPSAAGQEFHSVGTCFLGARDSLEQVGLEAAEYASLLARFSAIVPRDDASYAELSELGLTNLVRGFDCASLLDLPRAEVRPRGRFAYAFGRGLEGGAGTRIVERVARSLGLEAVPVAWLLGKYGLRNLSRCHERAIGILGSVEFLVTDIYHLSINAFNVGCPVYCLGRDEEPFARTCGDYKKVVLMEMLGLREEYIGFTETAGPAASVSEAIIARRRSGAAPQPGFQTRKESLRAALAPLWGAG